MISALCILGIVAAFPFAAATVDPVFGEMWTGRYSGIYNGVPVNMTMNYAPMNETYVMMDFILFEPAGPNAMRGFQIEIKATREVIYSASMGVPAGCHMYRAFPAEMSGGIGTNFTANIMGAGNDYNHTIIGDTSVVVAGVTLNCWIANATFDATVNQTLWLEKTTGTLVRLVQLTSGVPMNDLLLWSATNIYPGAAVGIPTGIVNPIYGAGWTGRYSGYNYGYTVNMTLSYAPMNETHVIADFAMFDAAQPYAFNAQVENNVTREIIYSDGSSPLPVGGHAFRASPGEMSGGIGTIFTAQIVGTGGDYDHLIFDQVSIVVAGVTLNCWVANATDGGNENQSLWLEKTTGMLVRLIRRTAGVLNIEFLLWSATNLKATPPASGDGGPDPNPEDEPDIPGYDVCILIGLLGTLSLVWWRRKGRSR